MAEKNKLSIICMSGDFDKAIAIFTMASGAAAVDYVVNLSVRTIPGVSRPGS